MCASDNILTAIFPGLVPGAITPANLTSGQTVLLAGSGVTELTASCLPSSGGAVAAPTCNITAAMKAFYCVQDCAAKSLSPMIITGFAAEKCDKKKKSKKSKSSSSSSRLIKFT